MKLLTNRYVLSALIVTLVSTGLVWNFFLKAPNTETPPIWLKHNAGSQQVIDHSEWQALLDDFVVKHDDNATYVDYQILQDEGAEPLNQYIGGLTALNPADYNRREQFAYWVNLYNALTLQLITEHYPVESITKLGKTRLAFGPWDDNVTTVAQQPLSLNTIEHQILRPIWQDHRIHFAVNCASIGCPNLQTTAFTSSNTEALLNQSAQEFVQHARGLSIGNNRLMLSSIFDWYQQDFGDTESAMLTVLRQYLSKDQQPLFDEAISNKAEINYDYNWGLNDLVIIE